MSTQSNTPFHTRENIESKNIIYNCKILVDYCQKMVFQLSREITIKDVNLFWDTFYKKIDMMNSRMENKLVVCQQVCFNDDLEEFKFQLFLINLKDLNTMFDHYLHDLRALTTPKATHLDTIWNDICLMGKLFFS